MQLAMARVSNLSIKQARKQEGIGVARRNLRIGLIRGELEGGGG